MTPVRTLSLALMAALAACKGTTTPSTGLPVGTVVLEVSGDTSFTVNGLAVYGHPQMTLTDQQGTQDGDFVQLFMEAPADPRERRYGLMSGSTFFIARGGAITRQFLSTSGWVDLYEVTAGNALGNAEMTLQELDLTGQPIAGRHITIHTVFNAIRS
jgi:hypothetical protein